MRILERYIGGWVIKGSLLALAVLLAMFTFFAFLDEMSDVGRGSYGVWDAAQYLVLTSPRRAFQLFPLAALLGSLLGLGMMASNSELTVVRASGVSLRRITWAVMKAGAVLMLLSLVLGEAIAPYAEEIAQERRSAAVSDQMAMKTSNGFWARDGSSFINIRKILPDQRMADIFIYEFDDAHQLRVSTHAKWATYSEDHWLLEDIEQSHLGKDGVQTRTLARAEWKSPLAPDLINVAVISPDRLSALGLVRYVKYLRENHQDSAPYQLALWGKLMAPVATGVMIFLAIPFAFGPLRSVGMGQRVLVGALVGIGFHILNQTFQQLGLVYGLSPAFSAILPTGLFFLLAAWMMRRVL